METTCRTENICKLLRSKEGAAVTTGVEGRAESCCAPFPVSLGCFVFPGHAAYPFFFFFQILKQEYSLAILPMWTSFVKEMRIERVKRRGTASVLNLCMAVNGQNLPCGT